MQFSNPYTQFVVDTGLRKLNNPEELIAFRDRPIPVFYVKGFNNLNITWGPWEFKYIKDTEGTFYALYNEAAMYEISLNCVNNTTDILDWILHISGKNENVYGEHCAYFLGKAFRQICAHSDINICKHGYFDGVAVARKYWHSSRCRRNISVRVRHAILERDGFRCCDCGASASTGAVLEVDHTIPVSKGGSNDPSNLRTLCSECNRGKSDRLVSYPDAVTEV
jgi:hypothetical protein